MRNWWFLAHGIGTRKPPTRIELANNVYHDASWYRWSSLRKPRSMFKSCTSTLPCPSFFIYLTSRGAWVFMVLGMFLTPLVNNTRLPSYDSPYLISLSYFIIAHNVLWLCWINHFLFALLVAVSQVEFQRFELQMDYLVRKPPHIAIAQVFFS